MKTLLVTEIFPPQTGGSGRWFWEMYRRLPSDQFSIAAGHHEDQSHSDPDVNQPIYRLPLTLKEWGLLGKGGFSGYLRAVLQIQKLIRKNQIRQIHCGRCLPEGLMALFCKLGLGVPYIAFVHGEDVSTARASRELSWLIKRVLCHSQYLIANSHHTSRILKEVWSVPESRVVVLYPGVDTHAFCPAPMDPLTRSRLGWSNRRVILTVGRLQARKGHDHLIQSLRSIIERVPDVLYSIIGQGEERSRLEKLVVAEDLGSYVQFRNQISDQELVQCYQQCDLFVLPNRQVNDDLEGFGMVLLEAQACGKAVIAGSSGGTSETMQTPETGLIVDCDHSGELAMSITDLLLDEDRRHRMGDLARTWVVQRFDWEALTKQAYELFVPE